MKNAVVFAGSFDPVTNGHLDIIRRAREIFGAVVVLVMPNRQKKTLFSLEERAELLRKSLAGEEQITVETAEGLLTDYLKKKGLFVVVRGIRNAADLAYEEQTAFYNKRFFPSMETVFLPARAEHIYLSSSGVKEAFLYGGDITSLVPPCVVEALRQK